MFNKKRGLQLVGLLASLLALFTMAGAPAALADTPPRTIQSESFTAPDQNGAHSMHQDVWWQLRVVTVAGQAQIQMNGFGTAYCQNAGGPYACRTVTGYFRLHVADGSNVDVPVLCGADIGHSPCPTVINKSTGWIYVVCGFQSNRYMGGDLTGVTTNTGNAARVTGRTQDYNSTFTCQ